MRTTSQILAALNADDREGHSLPELLCIDCTEVLDLTGAAMALMNNDGQQAVVGASGPLVAHLEDLQFELGEGASVDASRDNRPALHPDLESGAMQLWPGFGPAVLDAGVRAVFALPLQVGAVRLGSLGLYRGTPGHLDSRATSTALAYADAAVVVLLHLQAQMKQGETLHPQLGAPLEYRAEVHQATGFLSVRASVGLAEALLLLRAHAFASDRPLLDVARDVLAGRLRIHTEESDDE